MERFDRSEPDGSESTERFDNVRKVRGSFVVWRGRQAYDGALASPEQGAKARSRGRMCEGLLELRNYECLRRRFPPAHFYYPRLSPTTISTPSPTTAWARPRSRSKLPERIGQVRVAYPTHRALQVSSKFIAQRGLSRAGVAASCLKELVTNCPHR